MSREYEENMENPRERRSRRNPRMRDGQQESGRKQSGESGLKVMGDASVHPVSSGSRSAEGTKRRTAAAPAAAKTARGSAGGSGLTPRQ